ncbi:MAG: MFS transporter [Candidatus Aminicenantales bacterium]
MKPTRVLASSAIFHALNDGATVAVPMIFPVLLNQSYILQNYSQIGIISHLGLLTTFLFQIIIVQTAHRVRYQNLLLASFLGISSTLFLFSRAKNLFVFACLYLLFRLCDSFYHTLGLAWVSRTHEPGKMNLAMGIQSGSGNFGVFLAFLTAGSLAQKISWKAPLSFWAILGFLAGMLSYLLVRTLDLPHERNCAPSMTSWKNTFSLVLPYLPGFIFAGGGWGLVVYYAPSLLNHRFGVAMMQTGIILAAWIGLGTLITYAFGPVSRFISREKLAVIGLAGSFLSLFVVGLAPALLMAQVGLYLFGLFLFLIFPALQASVGVNVPPENQSQAFSIASNIQIVSGAVFSLVSGFLSDLVGIQAPFVMMAIWGWATLCLTSFFPRKKFKK